MNIPSWLRFLRRWRWQGKRRQQTRRPGFEQLETRVVPATALSIGDAMLAEGNAGIRDLIFPITRTGDLSSTLVVGYTTADGTATAGSDYLARSGEVTIPSGSSSAILTVPVSGDTVLEPDETLTVQLTGVNNSIGPAPSVTRANSLDIGENVGAVAVVTADLNGDGKPDLANVNGGRNAAGVHLNTTTLGTATTSFAARQDFATGADPRGIAAGDINSDGRPDLVTANTAGNSISLLLNTTMPGSTSPTFAPAVNLPIPAASSVAIGDFNSDGGPDLAVASTTGAAVFILMNTTAPGAASASFAPARNFSLDAPSRSVALGDFNRDGRLDFAAVGSVAAGTVTVYLNATPYTSLEPVFIARQDLPVGNTPVAVAVGDVNLDGAPDLAVSHTGSNFLSVLLNTALPGASSPAFAPRQDLATPSQAGSSAAGVRFADTNLDGKPDLVSVGELSGSVASFVNTTVPGAPLAGFAPYQLLTSEPRPAGVAAGDFNLDGKPDLAVVNSSITQPAEFIDLGSLTLGIDASADGSIVVGETYSLGGTQQAFYRTPAGALIGLGTASGYFARTIATAVSADGSVIAGYGDLPGLGSQEAFRWTAATGLVPLGDLPGGFHLSQAAGVSADGSVVVGLGTPEDPHDMAFRWTAATGLVPLGDLPGGNLSSTAYGVSADGAVVVGLSNTGQGNQAFRWTEATGLVGLGYLPGGSSVSWAEDAAADGSVIVGASHSSLAPRFEAFRWTAATGMVGLGDLPGGEYLSAARAVSADGSVIVGESLTGIGQETFIWDAAHGMRNLRDVLAAQGVTLAPGTLRGVYGMSPDGTTITGLHGNNSGYIVRLGRQGPGTISVLLNTTVLGAAPLLPDLPFTSFPVLAGPVAATTADFNLDGKPDLAVSNREAGSVSVMFNATPYRATSATFGPRQDFLTGSGPQGIAAADFNRDGKPDLAVANRDANTVSVLLNTAAAGAAAASFAPPLAFPGGGRPRGFTVADVNLDGKPDIILTDEDPFNQLSVFINTTAPGAATPSFALRQSFDVGGRPFTVAAGDINGDGRADLMVANDLSGTVSVLLNSTLPGSTSVSFTRTDFATASGSGLSGATLDDMNNDGRPDIVVAEREAGTVAVRVNVTAAGAVVPSFLPRQAFSAGPTPRAVAAGDLNGDGLSELITISSALGGSALTVLRNTSTPGSLVPSFAARQDFPAGAGGSALVLSEFNSDGRPDLAVVDTVGNMALIVLNAPVVIARSQATGVIVNDDPTTLIVTAFSPTNTGFTAQFSMELDRTVLNLYSIASGSLEPVDVTVVNTMGTPVRGSLVVSPTADRVTFIRTGGPLPPDTYLVFLRSTATGFRTSTGNQLDGNADNVPGDDYITSFTIPVPSSAAVVAVPDVTRGPGQPINVPATATGLPVLLASAGGVTSVSFDLNYDPALLYFNGFFARGSGLSSDAVMNVSFPAVGLVRVTITSTATPLGAGSIELVKLIAAVPDTARYASKGLLDLSSVLVNGLPSRDDDGIHVAGYFGDVTGNARISSADATQTLRMDVGLIGGFAAYPLADPRLLADIDANGRVNALDATLILKEAVGIDQLSIPPLPPNPPTITVSGPDPLLSIPRTFRGRPGEVVTIPVNLDVSDGLETAELALSYDTRRLTIVEVRRGSLTADFDLFLVNLDPIAGTIRVGLGRPSGPVEGAGGGSVVELVVRIRPDAPPGRAVLNLRGGLGPTMTELNEGGLDLNPDPTDSAHDAIDGLIRVVAGGPRRAATLIDHFFASSASAVLDALVRGRRRGPPL